MIGLLFGFPKRSRYRTDLTWLSVLYYPSVAKKDTFPENRETNDGKRKFIWREICYPLDLLPHPWQMVYRKKIRQNEKWELKWARWEKAEDSCLELFPKCYLVCLPILGFFHQDYSHHSVKVIDSRRLPLNFPFFKKNQKGKWKYVPVRRVIRA